MGGQIVVVLGGQEGVQEAVGGGLGLGFRDAVNVLPKDTRSAYDIGRDVTFHCPTKADWTKIFRALGHVFIILEGGPESADPMELAVERGALIIPMMSTGGAANGMFGFPQKALERPNVATIDEWQTLKERHGPT